MLTNANDPRTVCENSVGDGCSSCMASLFKPPERARDYTAHQCSLESRRDIQDDSLVCQVRGSSRLLLLTVVAFVFPIVVIITVVQFLESHVGSAVAAIAGGAAALLTAAISAGILKRITDRSAVTGADR